MTWFYVALLGPILYAVTNHIDKYILEKYFKSGEEGAMVLFSALAAVITMPIFLFVDSNPFAMDLTSKIVLTINGMLVVGCLILYLKALRDDEPSTVVPYYQTIPLFGFVLGYFVLGEVLGARELLAGILILIGTTIISLDFQNGVIQLKKRVALLMLSASFIYAAVGVIFKMITVDESSFWSSVFWVFMGNIIAGVIIFIVVKSYRQQFLQIFRVNSGAVLTVSFINEIVFAAADGVSTYAVLLAPIALVMVVNGFQPLFVFLIGIGLTLFFPKLGRESMTGRDLAQKIVAIAFIIGGTILLDINIG